jgi:hypothetical protein
MELLPSEILDHIINNIWNLDTLIKLKQTNKLLYDCVNSSYSFNKFKECYIDERYNDWYMPKSKEEKLYVIGCMRGILEIVREYSKEINRDIILTGFIGAARNGHLGILKWLKNNFNITNEDTEKSSNGAFNRAAIQGHIEIVKWYKDNFNITEKNLEYYDSTIIWATRYGQLEILKWFKYNFNITEENANFYYRCSFEWSKDNGHLNVLKWFKENFNITELN